jgi:hypothetical protein
MTTSTPLRILVLGYMIRMPLGGLAWHYLQYVLGLADLGHDVYYLEDSCFFEDDESSWFYSPATGEMGDDAAPGMRFVDELLRGTRVEGKWALFEAREGRWHGPAAELIPELCSSADLLLNISAANPVRDAFLSVPRRVLVDTDPTFSQVRILTNEHRRALASRHTSFMTFGETIGSSTCSTPTAGLDWKATRQPIVLERWPVTPGPALGSFTTILAWDSFRYEEYQSVRYGMKSDSFAAVIDLPVRTSARFELGLYDPDAVPRRLPDLGWRIKDGRAATRDPCSYQQYVRGSKGEFSVAKHGYVLSQCGWFSDRSATYLASGRPVILQETGFSSVLPTGAGLLGYRTIDEACAAVEEVETRYQQHCDAARDLAAEYFDARRVLNEVIARVG